MKGRLPSSGMAFAFLIKRTVVAGTLLFSPSLCLKCRHEAWRYSSHLCNYEMTSMREKRWFWQAEDHEGEGLKESGHCWTALPILDCLPPDIMEKNKESCNPCYTVAKHLINLYLLFCGRLTMQTETVVLGEMKGRIWNIVLYWWLLVAFQ